MKYVIKRKKCTGMWFDLNTVMKWKLFSDFLAFSYSAHSPDVRSHGALAWRIKAPFLQREGKKGGKTAPLWLSSFVPRTKERQKRRGERSGLSAFNHTSPSQNPHLRHRCRRAEMERRGEEREEWGGERTRRSSRGSHYHFLTSLTV